MLYKKNFFNESAAMCSHIIYFKTVKRMNQFILRDIARYEQTKINHGFFERFFFPNNYYPVPDSKIVGSAELRKRKHEEKKTGRPTFRVPLTFASSPLSESLEQAK